MRIPPVLWHYTDIHGALGIIRDGSLRLSDSRFLNDRTERTYGAEIVADVLREQADEVVKSYPRSPELSQILKRALTHLDRAVAGLRLYLCSFSDTSESISQWQRYAADGHGYCLGFHFRAGQIPGQIHKVVYQPSRQKIVVAQFLHAIIRRYVNGGYEHGAPTDGQQRVEHFGRQFAFILESVITQLKTPRFADEREWRLFTRSVSSWYKNINFGPRGPYPRPFITISVNAGRDSKDRLLTEVVSGPRLDNELATISMQHLLDATGYVNIRVSNSVLRDTWR